MVLQAGGAAVVMCDEGYQLRQSSNNKLVCRLENRREQFIPKLMRREDGSWRSSIGAEFPVCAEKGCLYDDLVIQPPENGNVEVQLFYSLLSTLCRSDLLGDWEADHLP